MEFAYLHYLLCWPANYYLGPSTKNFFYFCSFDGCVLNNLSLAYNMKLNVLYLTIPTHLHIILYICRCLLHLLLASGLISVTNS